MNRTLPFVVFLVLTAFLCGAMVMVVEVLGSRVIGPFFGVSLFVWTSLITVTLVALAVGYALGGLLSDRRENPDFLYGIIMAAGFLVLTIPFLKGPVLKASLPLGLRAGSLVSSLLLFGPCLLLLGCVSPYVIKAAAREMRSIGRTVGLFYAVSTIGSVVGTVLTGFVLITAFGVDGIFRGVGGSLIILSVAYFVFFRKKWPFLAMLFVLFAPLGEERPLELVRPSGLKVKVVYSGDSFYGNLKVVDYIYSSMHTRDLAIDGLTQSGIDIRTGQSVYDVPYLLEILPHALNPRGKTCLMIGLGAGVVPRWYGERGVTVDVVDIDPKVFEIAEKYFAFTPTGETVVSDARYFLQSTGKKYDYIILDVFNGDTTPGHLLSLEALRLMKERLAPGGVLAANVVGSLREEPFITASIVKTFEEVFPSVDCNPLFHAGRGKGYGNIVLLAYEGAPREIDPRVFSQHAIHPRAMKTVSEFIGQKYSFPAGTAAIILTDDYNPIDSFDLWLKESVREGILEDTDADVLI